MFLFQFKFDLSLPQTKFFIPKSLQPDYDILFNFKLKLFDLTKFIVWNIKGLYSAMGYKD